MRDDLIEEIKGEKIWSRKCYGILTLHTIYQASRDRTRGIKWKVDDTAKLLGLSIGYVSESIKLAKAFPKFEGQLEKMTRENALKILKEREFNQ